MRANEHVRRFLLTTCLCASFGAGASCGAGASSGAGATVGAEPPAATTSRGWDETARLIAGLPTGSPARAGLEARGTWAEHRAAIDSRWAVFEARQLAPMRRWAADELSGRISRDEDVLYPFSGPDLIHPLQILPGRSGYWMLSLEPVGGVPDLAEVDEPTFGLFLEAVRQSLASALQWSFFQTRALRADFRAPGFDGVLPLLLFFAARNGQQVLDVRLLFVEPDGRLEELAARPGQPPGRQARGSIPGVRLRLRRPEDGAVHELVYFAVDLSSYSVEKHRGFFAFLAEHGPFTTYLKAASYLMFKPKYAAIERFLLENSSAVLQDDSGIPWASFQAGGWETRLYGRYRGPIPLFAAHHQETLAEAYVTHGDTEPLPFKAGYRTRRGESNLTLATRRRR